MNNIASSRIVITQEQNQVLVKTLHLVVYGCGDLYDRKKFKPIKNRQHVKPEGGLWASPVNCSFGWNERQVECIHED